MVLRPTVDKATTSLSRSAATQMSASRVAVVVASLGRKEDIALLLTHLCRQTLKPIRIVLSVEGEEDFPTEIPAEISHMVEIIQGPRGSSVQRNRGIERIVDQCEIIVFYDDDFVPADDALERIQALFDYYPEIVGATGRVIRDGVKQGGIPYSEAVALLDSVVKGQSLQSHEDTDAAYGCNMAFRAAVIGSTRFDEALPLYGWQEDVDFTGQMLRKGRVVKSDAFVGVHRGVSKGRTSGVKFGYSQIVNPAYLVRKGTMRPRKAIILALKNIIANHAKLFRSEPFIDRMGRAKGNWIGLWHLVTQRAHPRKVLEIH